MGDPVVITVDKETTIVVNSIDEALELIYGNKGESNGD